MSASNATVLNQYLHQSDKLTHFQRKVFWQSVNEARNFYGDDLSNDTACQAIKESWNNKHFLRIEQGDGLGLGGKIRAGHVKHLLREKGTHLKSAQVQSPAPAAASAPASRKPKLLKKDDISKLSHRDCAPWLQLINKPLSNTVGARKQHLRQHFEGRPDDYALQR